MTAGSFMLGTFCSAQQPAFPALVIGERAVALAAAHAAYRDSPRRGAGALLSTESVLGLLEHWQENFPVLQAIAEWLQVEAPDHPWLSGAAHALASLRPLPPVTRPSKILNCAANYGEHLKEMRQYTQTGGNVDPAKIYAGDKSRAQPYFFLKAPSSLIGAFDDIVLPSVDDRIDWEAELGVVIGQRCRSVRAERAMESVAGFLVFNDVSCRNRLFREDRPNFRTDWLSSKSFDTFGPCGPFLVPRAFVPDHAAVQIELRVNGAIKQQGMPRDMIYTPEEQMAYVSSMMTLEPGDIFATGTLGGVGQGRGEFLKAGDLVETSISGLGTQRNRVVAPRAAG
jgi:2,4-didehydro-3-deoxy-L-rhamnonate hydrolase